MENRSIWHIVALVATLGLAALVAIVAVTKGDRVEPGPGPSPSATPSATASGSPAGLAGDGPFAVYALGNEILAFDVAGGKSISLGRVEGIMSAEASRRQPGSGRLVAFSMIDGNIWTVTRRGLSHAAAIPSTAGGGFVGAVVSADDRKVAVATTGAAPTIVVVDLQTGKPTNLKRRTKGGQYPTEPLLPIAWSLGGTVLYEVPYCECGGGSTGLYALDTTNAGSTRVPGTSSTKFFDLAVAPTGQALYYGTASDRGCPSGPAREGCESAPYYLRRLAAGEAGSDIIRRASDYPFWVDAISHGGDLVLVHRPISEREGAKVELYSAEGERQPALRGVPEGGAVGVAILPGDIFVLRTTEQTRSVFFVLKGGVATTIAKEPETGESLTYLGWLR